MPRTPIKPTIEGSATQAKKVRRTVRKIPADVQKRLDEYHELVAKIGKLNLKPFSAGEQQQEMRRKELGG